MAPPEEARPLRSADHAIAPFFLDRWSPRAFTDAAIPDDTLFSAFEAARWAPSSFNVQPWRFIYAKRGGKGWEDFLAFTLPFNRLWAQHAAALVLFVSETHFVDRTGERRPSFSHSFDAGAAWSAFAHQALLLGWHTHAMGGFDRDEAKRRLHLGDDIAAEALVAIGRIGKASALPENLREREVPSARKPVTELAIEGGFSAGGAAR